MPCYEIDAATLAEERRLREEREQQLEQIEQQLEAGIATIIQNLDGTFNLIGATLPNGMFDACVLAELEKRNSQGFQAAQSQANNQESFITIHDRSHNR